MITITLPTVGEVQAEEGMTWAEFCDSEYNPTDPSYGTPLLAYNSSSVYRYAMDYLRLLYSGTGTLEVSPSTVLVDGGRYIWQNSGGGSN